MGDYVVDLACHHPFDDAFEGNSAPRFMDGGIGIDKSGMFGEVEEFKPSGLLVIHFYNNYILSRILILTSCFLLWNWDLNRCKLKS